MAQGISFLSLVEHQAAVASMIQREPNVDVFMSRVSGNTGMVFIRLKPREIRKMSCDQIIEKLRKQLADIPGAKIVLQNPPPIQVGGRMSKAEYQYTLQGGASIDELYECSRKMENVLSSLPELRDVSSDMQITNPQVNMIVDRDKAATMRVSVAQIENALYSAYGPRQISTIYAPEDQYSVLLELQPQYRRNSAALSLLYVRSSTGQQVPLSDLVRMEKCAGPLSVNHTGQLPSVTISFNLNTGVSLGQALDVIAKAANTNLANGVTASFQGTAKAFQDSMKGMNLLLILTVVVIYIVLGILYESFIHPITILTALPFAGLGALLSLWVCNIELSLYAFVGIIMLVGIVKKNGIMMIDFAIVAQRTENKSPEDAIIEACLVRFRPIMMTTFAALMAGIPIAIGWGAGGEARRPLGVAVVGGLLFSQLLTLYVTPVFYVCMEKLRVKLGRKPAAPVSQGAN